MAYETTDVPAVKSQAKIREMIMRNKGKGIAIICQPPEEGFQALLELDGKVYTIRVSAALKETRDPEQETRRIWRVLYHHMKDIFEASNSGVMEFRELILPYIVTSDGQTIAQHILPKLDQAIDGNPARLLPAPRSK